MERMTTVAFDDLKALTDFVRGKQICVGTMTAGSGPVTIEDTTKNFTTLKVAAGFRVYDKTTGESALIESVAATQLTVPTGAWADTNAYEVRGPAIPQDKIIAFAQENDGQWHLCYYRDDGFAGDSRIEVGDDLDWLMSTGGAAADRSSAFYLKAGLQSAHLEIAWTFVTDDIALERYVGDGWEVLTGAEAVLAPAAGNFGDVPPGEWSQFPTIAAAHTIFLTAAVQQGAYDLLAMTNGIPGWYRLRSNSAPAGADIVADKKFKIVTS